MMPHRKARFSIIFHSSRHELFALAAVRCVRPVLSAYKALVGLNASSTGHLFQLTALTGR